MTPKWSPEGFPKKPLSDPHWVTKKWGVLKGLGFSLMVSFFVGVPPTQVVTITHEILSRANVSRKVLGVGMGQVFSLVWGYFFELRKTLPGKGEEGSQNFLTWCNNLCIIERAPDQHNWMRKRGRCPGCVTKSCQTGIKVTIPFQGLQSSTSCWRSGSIWCRWSQKAIHMSQAGE